MESLVSTDWLAARLGDPDLVVFDCTVLFLPDVEANRALGREYHGMRIVSGRESYEASRIPGARFVDLVDELSEPEPADSGLVFTLPTPERVEAVMRAHGVSNDSTVVLYARGMIAWATRVWWILHINGFSDARILNGGFDQWVRDGRAVATDEPLPDVDPGSFVSVARHVGVVAKDDVRSMIERPTAHVIDTLPSDLYEGTAANPYGRPGHIESAAHLSVVEQLTDDGGQRFRSMEEITTAVGKLGLEPGDEVATYCGGGILATAAAYALHELGHQNVSIYDNSMSEWGYDESLPMRNPASSDG